jgi:hypothetical protein
MISYMADSIRVTHDDGGLFRHQMALELLGEKIELVEELKVNLEESKLMFQTQIDTLISDQHPLSSASSSTQL